MCRIATTRLPGILLAHTLTIGGLWAQTTGLPLDWRRIGNSSMDLALPSVATGPVSRVWYGPDGSSLSALLDGKQIWETSDFENWQPGRARAVPERLAPARVDHPPEAGARIERTSGMARRFYALGRFVYRSEDGGDTWTNLTGFRNQSILGDGLADLAVSPRDPDEIAVAGGFGVWRSLDGGATWAGLNQGLPNLPARKLLALPNGLRATRLLAASTSGDFEIEWQPGERTSWRAAPDAVSAEERALRQQLSTQLGVRIEAIAVQGDWMYAGSRDGRLFVSQNRGESWMAAIPVPDGGAIQALYVNPRNPLAALAVLKAGPRLVRTVNGGQSWDDISGNLPPAPANAVTADPQSGSIYVATGAGVFYSTTDLSNLTPVAGWRQLSGNLPEAQALDVRLDETANQLYVLLEGYGVFATMAPHRLREWSIVNAADFSNRQAAPGSLLSILGARIERVRAGELAVPVLGATDQETQIQVPFEAQGNTLSLTLESSGLSRAFGLPLAQVSPAIFIDRDGAALLIDADSGMALDAANAARSGARVQILATGLGAVRPEWPTGIPAPMENAPRVAAPVRVLVDREPVEVTRATLAPGYVGFYVIEIQLPRLVNAGPAELYLETGGRSSNRVRLYLEP